MPNTDALVGQVLDGKYAIEAHVASAETGLIYRGSNVTIGLTVAIKVMPPEMQQDAMLVDRFQRETRLRSQLEHPNCVAVLDHGRDAAGRLYTVMEYVEGRRLSDIIAESSPLPIDRLLRVATQVLAALDEAHAHGIVHGEVKPWSVVVTQRPTDPDFAQLLGFGRLQDAALKGERFNVEPAYASPEQLQGRRDLDPRSDIYAAGVMLYEMLTGTTPYAGTPAQILGAQQAGPPVRPSQLRPERPIEVELESLVMECLALDREDRPRSADVLGQRLMAAVRPGAAAALTGRVSSIAPVTSGEFATISSVSAVPPSTESLSVDGPRNKMALWIAAAVVAAVLLGVAWIALRDDGDSASPDTAEAATPATDVTTEPGAVSDDLSATGTGVELEDPMGAANTASADGDVDQAATNGEPALADDGATEPAASDDATDGSSRRPRSEASNKAAAADDGSDVTVPDSAIELSDEPPSDVEYDEEDVDREDREARRKKRNKRSQERRQDSVTRTMLKKAEAYLEEGNKSGAEALVERVLERDPGNKDARKLKRRIDKL